MLPKPTGKPGEAGDCTPCPLFQRGRGFVPPTGPVKAKILFVGEAAGSVEVIRHEGFVGPAGGMLNRLLYYLDVSRKDFRLKNIVACQPPGDFLVGAPWEHEAIQHCRQYLDPVLDEGHDVVVALGGVALRALLDYDYGSGVTVKDFHGTVNRDPSNRFWVVPTFHPSHLQRGAANLMGTVLFDLQVAQDVAVNGFTRDKVSIIADPSIEWFSWWADEYLSYIDQDRDSVWMSVDIETDDKTGKNDEGELGPEDRSYNIIWINFSCNPDEGVTVPWVEPYITIARRILASHGVKVYWNKKYDVRRLRAAGVILNGPQLDMMDGWHMLQSDTPRGLGYVSPFHSNLGPWKHLGNYSPIYRGMDGIQTTRNANAIATALQKMGMWDSFWELVHEVDEYAWTPAEDVGLLIDPDELAKFTEKLARLEEQFFAEIQSQVPVELLRKYPKGGWIKEPSSSDVRALNETRVKKNEPLLKWEHFRKETVATMVQVCNGCQATQVSKKHRCEDRSLTPDVQLQQAQVARWYVVEEFNPGSWQQVLAYIIAKGHKPGRNRKRDNAPTTNRKTLNRLMKTGDKFYSTLINYREVSKVKGTYADGVRKRMDKDNRVHTTITSKPSTIRTSSVDPNLQNVVADKGGKEKIAAGFRRTVISSPGCKLVAIDYVGNEAAETGWFAGDPNLIKLSKLGLHGYITAGLPSINQPVDLNTWSEPDLIAHFKKLKKEFTQPYDDAKHGVYLCVPGDHQVLTPVGWVQLSKLSEGTPIAQWEVGGRITFKVPSKITRGEYTGDLVEINERGLQIQMTPNHRVPAYVDHKLREYTAETLPHSARVPVSGWLDGKTPWSPLAMLAIAVQADGCFKKSQHGSITFSLTKPRKIARLIAILNQLPAVKWTSSAYQRYTRFRIKPMAGLWHWLTIQKTFRWEAWLALTGIGKRAFLEEVLEWDGSSTRRSPITTSAYYNTNEHDATLVQTIAHLCGMESLFRMSMYSGGTYYKVTQNQRTRARTTKRRLTSYNGQVYCVTVPSGYFLVRWRDTISVTGNTLYGGGPGTMMEQYPDSFRTRAYAQMIQDQIYTAFPKVKVFHHKVRKLAEKMNFLGGPGGEIIEGMTSIKHPYNFRHWFWDVVSYYPLSHSEEAARIKKRGFIVYFQGKPYGMKEGNDWRRTVAYFPQSAGTGGKMRTDTRCLFKPGMPDYVGDYYFGGTPLRAPIHDELFSEVPDAKVDAYIEKCVGVMAAPIKIQPCPSEWGVGPYLTIGVSVKVGTNWQDMEEIDINGIASSTVASDFPTPVDETEDEPESALTQALS